MTKVERRNLIKLDGFPELMSPEAEEPQRLHRTPEGFLKGCAPVTNIGVFSYLTPEGVRRELRLPEDVFDDESLRTLALAPLTFSHPAEGVTPQTAGELVVGACGDVWHDPYTVFAQLAIYRNDALEGVQAGVQGLSCGYTCDLEETSGNWNGVEYDMIQRNIRYNHVALVSVPRAGDSAYIHLDGECVSPIPEAKDLVKDSAEEAAKRAPKPNPSPEFAAALVKLMSTMFRA